MADPGSVTQSRDSAASETAATLQLKDVEVTYPSGVQALKPINLRFNSREITVLLGPSGAGKSTLLRTLNLSVKPSRGKVISSEHGTLNASTMLREHRRRCAMIFQQHQLIGRLSALQNVLAGRLGHHSALRTLFPLSEKDKRLALHSLDRVGLLQTALSRCDQLSGGQQQRVGIARALVQQPSIILADEPVSSLDPTASRHVLAQLRDIVREDDICVVISLHQIEYAREVADRIIGLSDGQVVFDNIPDQLNDNALRQIYRNFTSKK